MQRILLVHNRYQQPGGEDAVFAAEAALLRRHGHEVVEYTEDNRRVAELSPMALAATTLWSRRARAHLARLLRQQRFDVAHFHNTFPLISPAAYYTVRAAGVPVVQTLHNYRLLCPNALFFRAGRVCEDCLGRALPWPGVLHRCYRGDRRASAVTAAMLALHRLLRTWTRQVDLYIALSEFARARFIQGGLPADRVIVKPNFIHPDPGPGEHAGRFALFVGRLSPEKGLDTLLAAWARPGARLPLVVVGDGPLAPQVSAAARPGGVEWRGPLGRERVLALMQQAAVLVVPSRVYETTLVIAEAYATGLPAIASDLASLAALVEPGRTGLLFTPGSADDLARCVAWAAGHPQALAEMSRHARAAYEGAYTAEHGYAALLDAYARAAAHAASAGQARPPAGGPRRPEGREAQPVGGRSVRIGAHATHGLSSPEEDARNG